MANGTGGATKTRDLRTGRPLWLAGDPAPLRGPAPEPGVRADVIVVGGGVSGALVADALLQAGKSVLAIDRRGLALGSSPASTALLQFELDTPLTKLSEKIGATRATRVWWRSATAVRVLLDRIADLGLRCQARERTTLYLPGNVLDLPGLRHEADARERIGLRSRFIGAAELKQRCGIGAAGAILSAGSAELDPNLLVRGLWRASIARGARVLAPAEVMDIDPGRSGVTLTLDSGARIRARHVVLATGFELPKLVRAKGHSIISTYAMATVPQTVRLWPRRDLIWQASDPYLYLRTTPDNRVIVGGEDEAFADEARRDALLPRKIATIRAKLARLMPDLDTTPDFTWCGSFGASETGMPSIGPVPGAPNCFSVMGFGGNGITFSAIAAQLISRAIQGLPDPDAELFAL